MSIRIFLLLSLFLFSFDSYSSPVSPLSLKLLTELEKIKGATGLLGNGKIFTKKEVGENLLIFENDKLFEAGLGLVTILKSQREQYENMTYDEWVSVTETLFLIDDWMDNKVAWGNLVIKSYIFETVFKSIYKNLKEVETTPEVLKYRDVLLKLSKRVPSKAAMATIAAGYYGFPVTEKVDHLGYEGGKGGKSTVSHLVELEGDSVTGISGTIYKVSDLERKYEKQLQDELTLMMDADSFVDIYNHPVPLHMSVISSYRLSLWELYVFSFFQEKRINGPLSWDSVDLQEVLTAFVKSNFTVVSASKELLEGSRGDSVFDRYSKSIKVGLVEKSLGQMWGAREFRRKDFFQSIHNLK